MKAPLPDRLATNLYREHIATHNRTYLCVLPFKYLPLLASAVLLHRRGRSLNVPLCLLYAKFASVCFFLPALFALTHGRKGVDLDALLNFPLAKADSQLQRQALLDRVHRQQLRFSSVWSSRSAWAFTTHSAYYPRQGDYRSLARSSPPKLAYSGDPLWMQLNCLWSWVRGDSHRADKIFANCLFNDAFDMGLFTVAVVVARLVFFRGRAAKAPPRPPRAFPLGE